VTDEPSGASTPRKAQVERAAIAGLADDMLPVLIARLRASRLGELEVQTDGWRVRLRRAPLPGATVTATAAPSKGRVDVDAGIPVEASGIARSPGVGYFSPSRDLVIGSSVRVGDSLGAVDVLGVSQDVSAPVDGIVSRVHAEAGEAVEYGQPLADIDPFGATLAAEEAQVDDALAEPVVD
jgi:biotin carboxyl carrier protein